MKTLVLGATGGIGSEIVSQAAGRPHQVTAFVRAPERPLEFCVRLWCPPRFRGALLPPAHLVGRFFFPSLVSDAADMEGVIVPPIIGN